MSECEFASAASGIPADPRDPSQSSGAPLHTDRDRHPHRRHRDPRGPTEDAVAQGQVRRRRRVRRERTHHFVLGSKSQNAVKSSVWH